MTRRDGSEQLRSAHKEALSNNTAGKGSSVAIAGGCLPLIEGSVTNADGYALLIKGSGGAHNNLTQSSMGRSCVGALTTRLIAVDDFIFSFSMYKI